MSSPNLCFMIFSFLRCSLWYFPKLLYQAISFYIISLSVISVDFTDTWYLYTYDMSTCLEHFLVNLYMYLQIISGFFVCSKYKVENCLNAFFFRFSCQYYSIPNFKKSFNAYLDDFYFILAIFQVMSYILFFVFKFSNSQTSKFIHLISLIFIL